MLHRISPSASKLPPWNTMQQSKPAQPEQQFLPNSYGLFLLKWLV